MGPNCFWRRGRDSNPRYSFGPYTGLANQRLQPLGHLSSTRCKHAPTGDRPAGTSLLDRAAGAVKVRVPALTARAHDGTTSGHAPVAQLDRAAAFEAAGRRF